ncbi:MAG: choice-of-anchor M domain-containing protein [Kofleriaceae bacterium]
MKFSRAMVTLFFVATASAAHAGPITSGHMDLDIDYSGGSAGVLTIDWKTYNPMSAGTPINDDDYAPAGNPVSVPLANAYTVPSSSSFACLGTAGSTVYRLKQAQDATQVWLGYNTQDVAASTFVNNKVNLELVSVVSAPPGGRFILYSTNAVGTPTYLFNSTAGACQVMSFPGGISTGVHNHGWWTFTAPGTYTLRFRASGTLTAALGGGTRTSADVDLTFQVP